ncbi:PucR family transcriptional regulator [Thermophilibacter sp.]
MAVRLRELSDRMERLGVTLVAGRDGLNRTVRWVHMVESIEVTEFLDGQELVCMTGIGVQRGGEPALEELVRAAAAAGASGVLINVGPYVKRIPDTLVAYCNEVSLPLFCAPWEVHLARVMHMTSLAVALADQESLELEAALRNALLKPDQESLYLEQLNRVGYRREWSYCVSALDLDVPADDGPDEDLRGIVLPSVDSPVEDAEPLSDALLRRTKNIADDLRTLHEWRMTPFSFDGLVILVFADYQLDDVRRMTEEVIDACVARCRHRIRAYAGVGKVTKNARCIGKSYGQAVRIARLQRLRDVPDSPCLYDEMGVDKLLVAVDDPAILEEFADESVNRIVSYDETHNSGLLEVLSIYLSHNGSVQQTADQLFVHRNTVTYKLNKIESLLDADLSDFETRVRLYLGIKAREIALC